MRKLRLDSYVEQLEDRILLNADLAIFDLNQTGGSPISQMIAVHDKLYFRSFAPEYGGELFAFDPVSGVTALVSDINAGPADSTPREFFEYGGKLFFHAYDSLHGFEPRVFDPATGLTSLLADINVGVGPSVGDVPPTDFGGFYAHQGRIYFTAFDAIHGNELREYDPTTQSLRLVGDVYAGAESSDAGQFSGFASLNGKLYFSAADAEYGHELREFDPLTDQIRLVADISSGTASSHAGQFTGLLAMGSRLFFAATDPTVGLELREYAPSTGNVQLVADLSEGVNDAFTYDFGELKQLNGILYFPALVQEFGSELYSYDPANGNISIVSDIYAGAFGSEPGMGGGIVELEDKLYFPARDIEHGIELREFNPATDEVRLVADINTDSAPFHDAFSPTFQNFRLFPFDGKLFFTADGGSGIAIEPWVYDPSTDDVSIVSDIHRRGGQSYPSVYTGLNGRVYFVAINGSRDNLYAYDAAASVLSEYEVYNGSNNSYVNTHRFFETYVTSGEKTYFAANRTIQEFDPNLRSLTQIVEIPGSPRDHLAKYSGLTAANGKLYFSADSNSPLLELNPETNDLRELGVRLFGRIEIGSFRGKLYFAGITGTSGVELMEFDPATDDLRTLSDFDQPESYPGERGGFVEMAGRLYFSVKERDGSYDVYEFDPLTDEIRQLTSSLDIPLSGENFHVLKGRIYFTAWDEMFGMEPRYFDPATNSVGLVGDINEGGGDSYSSDFVSTNDKLYFTATDSDHGRELREYDPETGQSRLVADIAPGRRSSLSTPRSSELLHVLNNKVYFVADDGSSDEVALWEFDPETDSLRELEPQNSTFEFDSSGQLNAYAGKLYFGAAHSIFGHELFEYNPVSDRIEMVVDASAGAFSSAPGWLGGIEGAGDSLFFSVRTRVLGYEVGVIELHHEVDFDQDGVIGCLDVDALTAEIAQGSNSLDFDLTLDGVVDINDLNGWLQLAGANNLDSGEPYPVGDANLDGSVDVADFNRWNNNKFTANSSWCSGDFTADGVVDVSDFNAWNERKFTTSAAPLSQRAVDIVLATDEQNESPNDLPHFRPFIEAQPGGFHSTEEDSDKRSILSEILRAPIE